MREATDRLNTKIQEHEQAREVEQEIDDGLTDEEIDRMIKELERKREREKILRCKKWQSMLNLIKIV